ncbi:50S ribosomal protein L18 [Candidatus Woesebacteria bacterium RIFCSPHIGHO2_12_FULL_46_16]|uniref:Large ribosomal subunit protein uL18 n=3 Tax=Microgenomates group TaxID=1794810 RepID=A0A0H4TFY5_9BACT|nr:50S ribosomal protein L18, large subunit ribosomal protein L18 [uncultured Microgenomates bacterium Rifle_16ft_4_minimus_37906]AKQ05577.1 50S ribosomal protein L18, large subunit ribosomal protein L18 [uncultured Microgenomates bacterium Rifle_16ft_4_minimus_24682]OGM57954.1 MAG: 50S ribosomal protein L18 [Candidatus Woesebacteria bacterium RIFCSPHIGHO2_12_FULL_46_16]
MEIKRKRFLQRQRRVRAKIANSQSLPRLSVFRSNKFIYAQIIDDAKGKTLAFASSAEKSVQKAAKTKTEKASLVGESLAGKAKKAKIKKVVFERSGYKYHGQVKALAEGARKGGLEF